MAITHSMSLISLLIESPCNFLLVIITNLHPNSYCFEVMADYCSNLVQKTATASLSPLWVGLLRGQRTLFILGSLKSSQWISYSC